jgi:hypothetical protein
MKELLGEPGRKWENNIKLDFKGTECESVASI